MIMMIFRIRNTTTTTKNGHHRHRYNHPIVMLLLLLLLLSLIIFNNENNNVVVNGQDLDQEDLSNLLKDMDMSSEECSMFAQQGSCDNPQLKYMMETKCLKECQEFKRESKIEPKMDTATIDDPDDFYNLKAKKYGTDDRKSSVLDFERFEGYITLIVNMALVCDSDHFDIEEPLKLIEHLHDVWPYNLEILFFPYRVTEPNYYDNKSCAKDKSILNKFATKNNKGVHIMEEVKLNGPNTHPVYKFLKGAFKHEKIDLKHASYYFISPDAHKVVMYHAIPFTTLKKFVSKEMQNLQYIADGKEL